MLSMIYADAYIMVVLPMHIYIYMTSGCYAYDIYDIKVADAYIYMTSQWLLHMIYMTSMVVMHDIYDINAVAYIYMIYMTSMDVMHDIYDSMVADAWYIWHQWLLCNDIYD